MRLVAKSKEPLPHSASDAYLTRATIHKSLDWDVTHGVSDASSAEAGKAMHHTVDSVLGQLSTELGIPSVGWYRSNRISRINCGHITVK